MNAQPFSAYLSARPKLAQFLDSFAPWLLLALPLGLYTTQQILQLTNGRLAVPLDDAYIHFQYARALRGGHFFQYTPGSGSAPGATSLLWPALLACFQSLGFDGERVIGPAWLLGWLTLALSAYETRKLAQGLVGPVPAALAGSLQLSLGANAWFASSGMETPLLAWGLARAARLAAEWAEGEARPRAGTLWIMALVCPLSRPEGVLGSAFVALSLALFPAGGSRLRSLPALLFGAAPWLVNWLFTGSATSTTAQVKWLWLSPYFDVHSFTRAVANNVDYLFGELLNGHGHAAPFLPQGGRELAVLGVVALLVRAQLSAQRFRGVLAFALALGILLPTTYDSFLWNRLRYLWPFAPAWFCGLAALVTLVTWPLRARAQELAQLGLGIVLLYALGSHFFPAVDDLAVSAAGITEQQVSLGKWAKTALPRTARIGVNDAGAVAYFSDRQVFDVVGLTTPGEARYWANGAGSRFEHYERLPRAALPTHFIVYPGWFALPELLGPCLTERYVPWATVLGGSRMVACAADYGALGSGALPESPPAGALIDEVDVADLESEQAHGYVVLPARAGANFTLGHGAAIDGARAERTVDEFSLQLAPGGMLVLRVAVDQPLTLGIATDAGDVGRVSLSQAGWQELHVAVPHQLPAGLRRVKVTPTRGAELTTMHYWSYR